MDRTLYNEKGSGTLLVAIALTIISMMASVTIIALVNTDTNNFLMNMESYQEEVNLRGESVRTNLMIANGSTSLQPRNVEVTTNEIRSVYTIRNKAEKIVAEMFMGMPVNQAFKTMSLCTAERGSLYSNRLYSPIRKYTEKIESRKSLAIYFYFTDTEKSDISDGDDPAARVKFWGVDEIWGKVHSNSDIWIQHGLPLGGDAVNPDAEGWPLFYDMVTTTGHFMNWDTNAHLIGSSAPVVNIFTGAPEPGYQEEVAHINFEPDATLIKQNGIHYGGGTSFVPNRIYYAHINGHSIEVQIGSIQQSASLDTFVVYSTYPDAAHINVPIGDSLWTNYINMPDTMWVDGQSASINNTSIFFNSTVWVKGIVSGKMTIGSAGNAYIVGNIEYTGTTQGQRPDNPDNPNRSDYFGLVSEKKIIIKYKHKEMNASGVLEKKWDNSVGPSGNVYLYGAFAAIGGPDYTLGETNAYKGEGTFTYEYQHPHGSASESFHSISPITGNDTIYTYIDFHRYQFPPTSHNSAVNPYWKYWPGISNMFEFPNGTGNPPQYSCVDYPWQNPVWPERMPGSVSSPNPATDCVYERGNLHVFGAVHQRRRGFIHRSGTMTDANPDLDEFWDIEDMVYGPNHASTGYTKQYRYDNRLEYTQPPDYPEVYEGLTGSHMSAFNRQAWYFRKPPSTF